MRGNSTASAHPTGAAHPLPFADFVDLLRASGLGIGLHEYLAVGKLLQHWDDTDRAALRDSLAALLARSQDEVETIRRLFDTHYPEVEPAPPAKPHGLPVRTVQTVRTVRSRRTWQVALAALSLLVVAVALTLYFSPGEFPRISPPATTNPPLAVVAPIAEPVAVELPGEPPAGPLPAPPRAVNWPSAAWLAAAVGGLVLIPLWGRRVRDAARRWTTEAWELAQAALPGPYHARLVLKDLVTRLPRKDVEEAATLLARTFSTDVRGRRLDVVRSVRATLKAGMLPTLVFERSRVQESILVLQDISQAMGSHTSRVEGLLDDLRRQGVVFERWYFNGDVSRPSRRPHDVTTALEDLLRHRGDDPVLIVSSGLGLPSLLESDDTGWLTALRRGGRRVWMTPIAEPLLWPAALQRVGCPVVPMTRRGLVHAAAILAGHAHAASGVLARIASDTRPVTARDVDRLKTLASLVPYPTLSLLELLRQRFAPDVPESGVLFAAGGHSVVGEIPIRLSDEEIRDHAEQVRADAPSLEREVRSYLLKVLNDSRPPAGSAAELRWQTSVAIHEVHLARLRGEDPDAALKVLRDLSRGPLWEEVREAMKRQPAAAMFADNAGMPMRSTEPPAFRDASVVPDLPRFRWVWPTAREIAAAAAAALIAVGIGLVAGPLRLQASHQLNAYALDFRPSPTGDGGTLEFRWRDPKTPPPATVRLYRDGAAVGEPVTDASGVVQATFPVAEGGEPHVWQVRAPLESGALALSNAVWAPSVLVVIRAQPWARLTIASADGRVEPFVQETPVTIRLPAGVYNLSLENGGVTDPLQTQITVAAAGTREFDFAMPGFDPDRAVEQLAGPQPAARY